MKDVLDLDLQLYLRNLLPQEDALLQEMRSFAEEHYISIVDPEVGYLLHLLTGLVQPQTILEIGTAIGCSAIYMARAMEKGTITTIELQERASSSGFFMNTRLTFYFTFRMIATPSPSGTTLH